MNNRKITLLIAISALSLTACVATPPQPAAKTFAPVCPTPTDFTPEQAGQVADALEAVEPKHARGLALLATEWDRLDNAARICRGA